MKLGNGFRVFRTVFKRIACVQLEMAILFLLAAIPSFAQPSGQSSVVQSATSTVSLHDRVWIASQAYSDIQTYFGHWRVLPGIDFDKEFQAYIDQILSSDDRLKFDLATSALLARSQNGHSGFGDRWMFEKYGQPLGFYAYPFEGKWVVVRSSVKGIKAGDIITGIEWEKIGDFYGGLRQYISGSDERWKQRSFFEYPYLFPQSFSVQLASGATIVITRHGKFQFPGEELTEDTIKEDQDVVYIQIPSFSKPNFEEDAVKAVQKRPQAKAIIFDVRSNHGGNTPSKLVRTLMDRPYRWFAEATPLSIGLFKSQGELDEHSEMYWYGGIEQPQENAYGGDVYVLIDGGCFSACEDFIMPFKNSHRAVLAGEKTAGSSGQPFVQIFDNGMLLQIGTKREFFPDGGEFEGVGISPDVEVHTTAADIDSIRDPVLAKVSEMIRAKDSKP